MVRYEQTKIKFIQPLKKRTYTPDFVLDNGIIIEVKGRFLLHDRQKHIMVRTQYPELDIRFVLEKPASAEAPINSKSKTTIGMWLDKKGFQWSITTIPQEWFNE